jgi:hypothetical protein
LAIATASALVPQDVADAVAGVLKDARLVEGVQQLVELLARGVQEPRLIGQPREVLA